MDKNQELLPNNQEQEYGQQARRAMEILEREVEEGGISPDSMIDFCKNLDRQPLVELTDKDEKGREMTGIEIILDGYAKFSGGKQRTHELEVSLAEQRRAVALAREVMADYQAKHDVVDGDDPEQMTNLIREIQDRFKELVPKETAGGDLFLKRVGEMAIPNLIYSDRLKAKIGGNNLGE